MKKIVQFAYKYYFIDSVDPELIVDCRAIRNPYYPGITKPDATDRVREDPNFESLVDRGVALLKKHPVIYVGCLYGVHRSVVVTMEIANRFFRPIEIEFANGMVETLK